MSLLDLKDSFYRKLGYTGSVQDMELENLKDLTGLQGSVQDILYTYLGSLGFSGSLQDRLMGYLGGLGYSGALQDRIYKSLIDGSYLNGAFADTTLYLNFATGFYNQSDWLCTYVPENEEPTTLYLAFDGNYYSESDYLCNNPVTLLLNFAIDYYVEKQSCI